MNLPLDTIHHIHHGYGRILVPLFGYAVALFRDSSGPRVKLVHDTEFHNCRRMGVY